MPDLLDRCFTAVGARREDFLRLHRLDPLYRARYEDGSVLDVRSGRAAMTDEIARFAGPTEAEAFGRFCEWLTALYRVEMPNFIDRNFDSPLDLVRSPGPAVELARLGAFGRLASRVGRFFADERLQRIFSFQSMYAGLAPYEALALYGVITYMDTVAGVYRAEGGMHAVPVALAEAAAKAGVTLRYGEAVERIVLRHGTRGPVRGVRLAGGELLEADAVVCNPDLPVAYATLLGGLPAPRVARRGTYSPSCVVWHVGTRGPLPPDTAHHNIHFGRHWDEAFRAILHEGRRMPDPSLLVTVPSLDDRSAAPAGGHTLYVLEPTPNLDGGLDWTGERARVRADMERRLLALGYPVGPGDIEAEELVDPQDWERQGMARGTPFALSHRFFQTGPFRPDNVDRRAPGLVFVGSGTRPGVGIPMVLVSGRLAAERVRQFDTASKSGRHGR
jgi:phytoene desaturase